VAWEKRGNKKYLYFSHRSGDRVRKSYFGSGPEAKLAAARVAEEKAARASERAILGAMRARWEPVDQVLGVLDAGCSLLIAAELTAAGFYRHDRGAWRRRGGLREA
jgi:hypothetical protein